MNHVCGNCGGRFACNGGAGHPCTCGQAAVPRERRRCEPCANFEREQRALQAEMRRRAAILDQVPQFIEMGAIRIPVAQPVPVPQFFDPSKIPVGERCYCNKCENLW